MDFSKEWISNNIHLIEPNTSQIPRLLHLIWVGDNELPSTVKENIQKWQYYMPDWTIQLWTNKDIETRHFTEEIISKIHEAIKPAQKADIMRYFIVEKYGGFYMDTDITPHRSLTPLTQLGFDLVLYHDNDLTWEYIINCAFGAIPHHPVLKRACDMIRCATLNTDDVHFKTGPSLWGRSVASVSIPGKKYALLSHRFFDKKPYFSGKYGTHTYAASWVNN
jgi:mannosyltransferase OCH1-like enzyme